MSNQKLFPIGNFNSTGITLKLDNENKTIILYSYINDPMNAEELTFLTSANLTGYVKTSDLTEILSSYLTIESFGVFEEAISGEIQSINETIKNLDISDKLDGYVKFDDLNAVSGKLQRQINVINTGLATLVTKDELTNASGNLQTTLRTELATVSANLATKEEVKNISNTVNENKTAIETANKNIKNVSDNLVNYATTQSVNEVNVEVTNIKESLKDYVTVDSAKDFITINDVRTELTDYATIKNVDDKVKTVKDALSGALSGYVTKENLSAEIKDMATDQEVADAIASALIGNATSGFVMEEIEKAIENMATDQEVSAAIKNAVSGLASDAKVTELISAAVSSLVTPDNISGFATKTDLDIVSTDIKILSGEVKNINYTAWEVYPTDRDLEPGEYSKTFIIEGNEETFINSTKISAGMTEQFAIYTNSPVAESDIIIDWGDGNTSSIKNGDYFSVATEDNQEYRIEVAHTYEVPNQIYTVKVYGKKYWKVAHIASTNNIMCRCIADDLPVASHLMTMANFATRANRLLYVNIPAYHKVLTIPNWANAFMGCVNLVKATGFKRFYSLYTVGNLFNTCLNLVDTDIRIPQTVTDISYIFHDCKQLSKDITKLFANQNNVILGFTNDAINVQNAFYGCQKLFGTIPAQIFWNEHSINFIGKETCFKDCSLSSTAPVSWGGTASDAIIETPTNNKVNELTGKVSAIETTVSEINGSLTNYATKDELETASGTIDSKFNGYITNDAFISTTGTLDTKIEAIDTKLSGYATKIDLTSAVTDITNLTEGVSNKVNEVSSKLDGYATKKYVDDLAADLDIVSGDIKILSDEIKNIDYTAWEVYPTDKDLAPGEYSKTFIVEGQEVTFTNPTKVDAGMTEQFAIYTNSPAEESDVIVDWGDGSISSIKNGDYFSVKTDDNQEYIFEVAHTYEVPNQTYTVKVYGRKYWKIGHIATSGNLMSRCFTDDLPIASHLMSLGNFACRAFKLLYVNIPAYHRVLTIPTWVNCFLECKNLLKATGFKRIYPLYSLGHLFHGCWNLTDTDFRIPTTATDISYIFCSCQSLVKDVSSLFDNQANTLLGFANSTVSINYSFYGTRRITGTIPADILWNNQKTKFLGSGECFTNSALSSQAPISWGGTASDTIIETPTNNKVNELTGKVSELETTVSEINDSLTDIDGQQHIFSMTSAELASATIVENSIYVNKDTGAVKVSDNESKLQDISYPIVDTQVLLAADEETLKKSIPTAQAILDLFSVKFVKVTNVNAETGEVTVIDSENGEYTVRYK
jgi:hypothetical protein